MILNLSLILLSPFVGGLIYGLERKLKARLQNRTGPSIFQPFFDFLKLANKRSIVVNSYHARLGVLHFIGVYIALAMLLMGGDLFVILFVHLMATLFLVIAAFSAQSPFSHIGANRELVLMAVYEPIFALCVVAFYVVSGSFEVSKIVIAEPAFFHYPLLFFALIAAIAVKLKKSPFDAAEAHQEIVGGVEIEYSGLYFEAIYTTKWLDYIYTYAVCFLFGGNNIVLGVGLAFFAFVILNILDNSTARLTYAKSVNFFLIAIFPASFLNILVVSWIS